MSVSIQYHDFDVAQELAALRAGVASIGAVCSFVGTVRGHTFQADIPPPDDAVLAMDVEHYPDMTEKSIMSIMQSAADRFSVVAIRVVHRVGRLQPGDQIVLVAVAAEHRGISFCACEMLMDYLKTQAIFWKKEHTPQGARWVQPRESDATAVARWN